MHTFDGGVQGRRDAVCTCGPAPRKGRAMPRRCGIMQRKRLIVLHGPCRTQGLSLWRLMITILASEVWEEGLYSSNGFEAFGSSS